MVGGADGRMDCVMIVARGEIVSPPDTQPAGFVDLAEWQRLLLPQKKANWA